MKLGVNAKAVALESYDPEVLPEEKAVCVFFLPTYEDGMPPETGTWFYMWLDEVGLLRGRQCVTGGVGLARGTLPSLPARNPRS